jgi:AraC family transcriptional regulator
MNEGLWPQEPQPIRDREALVTAADRLLALLVGDDALATRQRANALESLLLEIARQQIPAPGLPTWVLDVQRRLLARWRETPDYSAIANAHHMPEHRLRRDFRAAVGLPIHTWLLRQRHAEAQRLLLNSDDDLATIADACGFQDQAFFSRQFRIHVGMSPSQWRRAAYG